MKRIIGYLSLFISVAFVSALLHLPAHIVIKHLPLPSGLVLQGVKGTIWNGSASQVRWQQQNAGAAQWQWQWSALLKAQARLAVRFGRGSDVQWQGRGVVGYGWSGPFAEHLVISLPAKQLQPYLTLPIPLTFEGQVELTLRDYRYRAPWCDTAQGVMTWDQGQVGSPLGELALGAVVADFTCQQSVFEITGGQQTEQVSSEFSLRLQADRSFAAQAWFKPGAQFPASLAQQLDYLPSPDSQGRYSFSQQGRL